uniref:General transcription factor IIF subunit 2 n=1 Tax=Sus scrofa TaxID=9823 RepID=A0A8D0Q3E2_PIG
RFIEADLTEIRQNRGMWLSKVPSCMTQFHGKALGKIETGPTQTTKARGKLEVTVTRGEECANIHDLVHAPLSCQKPKEHQFYPTSIFAYILQIFFLSSSSFLSLCGLTIRRCRCRPAAKQNLRRLERGSIASDNDPGETQQQLSKVITSELSRISNHNLNIEYHRHVSDDSSRARTFKRFIITLLYSVKSRHRSISLKKIVKIWKQPKRYRKKNLKKLSIQKTKKIHKATWKLSPEYKYYHQENKSD